MKIRQYYKPYSIIKILVIITIIVSSLNSSCFDDNCENIIDINFDENVVIANLKSNSQKLSIGDTLYFSINIPEHLTDNEQRSHLITLPPKLLIRFADQTSLFTLDSSNVFSINETLHAEFNEHFKTIIKTGEKDEELIFFYYPELNSNEYNLEIEFIAKKTGIYLVQIGCRIIEIEGYKKCINISSPKLNWQQNTLNKVLDYYGKDSNENSFVFEVN